MNDDTSPWGPPIRAGHHRAPKEDTMCVHGNDEDDCEECLDVTSNRGQAPDADDTMDQMVQRASTPTLASLYRKGKEAGIIKPGQEYGHTA